MMDCPNCGEPMVLEGAYVHLVGEDGDEVADIYVCSKCGKHLLVPVREPEYGGA